MLARAKIKLAGIPSDLLENSGESGVQCRIRAANPAGQPASGTVKPPAVVWAADPG